MVETWLSRGRLYLRLFRLQTGAATAVVPVLGAIVTGVFSSSQLVILFVLGLLYHIFGFVLNEYIDVSIDEKAPDLQRKPLVSGKIPKQFALIISGVAITGGIIILLVVFQNVVALLFFLIAVMLGAVYDVWGKKIYGLDFVLGAGFSFLVLSGARTSVDQMPLIVVLVSIVLGVHIVFNNAIEGGLKDAKNDKVGGARTVAQRLGVDVSEGTLHISRKFVSFGVFLRVLFFVVLGAIYVHLSYSSEVIVLLMSLVLGGVSVWSLVKFLVMKRFDRAWLKRSFSIHEIVSYSLLILVLSPFLSLVLLLVLVLLPIVWYIMLNIVLYGYFLEPQV